MHRFPGSVIRLARLLTVREILITRFFFAMFILLTKSRHPLVPTSILPRSNFIKSAPAAQALDVDRGILAGTAQVVRSCPLEELAGRTPT